MTVYEQAMFEKNKGNKFFKKGSYSKALVAYSDAIVFAIFKETKELIASGRISIRMSPASSPIGPSSTRKWGTFQPH